MKLKKIIAPTMAQAIKKVKEELGDDAVIFHTKKVESGRFFNLFKKEHIEVLAASDPEPISEKRNREAVVKHPEPGLTYRKVPEQVDRLFDGPNKIDKIRSYLVRQGLAEHHIDILMKVLVKSWYQNDERMSEEALHRVLTDALLNAIKPDRFIRKSPESDTRPVMLVGATGVGKTTTIAKLAGQAVLDTNKKIAFITFDTYRIAAIEQLKIYAGILEAPIEVAYQESDLVQLIAQFSSLHKIYIDTAGRNFREPRYVKEIAHLLHEDLPVNVYLLLSATAKYEDMTEIIRQFAPLPADQLILTKFDETGTYGSIVSLLMDHPDKKVAYLTDGQNVPDDLRRTDGHELIHLLLGGLYGH